MTGRVKLWLKEGRNEEEAFLLLEQDDPVEREVIKKEKKKEKKVKAVVKKKKGKLFIVHICKSSPLYQRQLKQKKMHCLKE